MSFSENEDQSSQKALSLLSNSKFLRWFFLLNGCLVLGLLWTGPGALIIPILGFAGALFSLVFAKWLAKRAHNIRIIDSSGEISEEEGRLYDVVSDLVSRAGLKCVPEVGIYESPDMNAFATGINPNNALIAFSSGLLKSMDFEQVKAVAAHEIAHIANRDMLGIVLLQGVINSIILFATWPINMVRALNFFSADANAWIIESVLWIVKTLAALLLAFLGSLVVKAFSRRREYRADAFAAFLLGKDSMISALNTLSSDTEKAPMDQGAYAAFKISGKMGFLEIFSTHPPIEKRISALESEKYAPENLKNTKAN